LSSYNVHLCFFCRSTSSETVSVTTRKCKSPGRLSILPQHLLPFQLPAPLAPVSPCASPGSLAPLQSHLLSFPVRPLVPLVPSVHGPGTLLHAGLLPLTDPMASHLYQILPTPETLAGDGPWGDPTSACGVLCPAGSCQPPATSIPAVALPNISGKGLEIPACVGGEIPWAVGVEQPHKVREAFPHAHVPCTGLGNTS